MTPLRYFIMSAHLGVFIDGYKDIQLWTLAETGGAGFVRTFATADEAYAAILETPGMPEDSSVMPINCGVPYCPIWELKKAGHGVLLGASLARYLHWAEPAGCA